MCRQMWDPLLEQHVILVICGVILQNENEQQRNIHNLGLISLKILIEK